MKRHQREHTGSLLFCLLMSACLFTGISLLGKNTVYQGIEVNVWKEPILSIFWKGVRDGRYPWSRSESFGEENIQQVMASESIREEHWEETSESETSLGKEEKLPSDADTVEQENDVEENTSEELEGKEEEAKSDGEDTYVIGAVEQTYFDDVLFIGDSRTVGLSEYSYLENATFYADTGLSVYSIFDRKICKVGKKMVKLEVALKKKKFKAIYLCLGINELGTGTEITFQKKYKEVIERIEELQPEARIVIQSIMSVGKKRSKEDPYFNNKNIAKRNQALEELADHQKVFYLNVNEVFIDKKGNLQKDISFDEIHLKAKYYNVWADYLMEHGIYQEIDEEK